MSQMERIVPDTVPGPIAWGRLQLPAASSEGYFYLTRFVDFEESGFPDVSATVKIVARLHASGLGTSDEFGSPIPIYDGLLCHVGGWEREWTTLFKMLWQTSSLDRSINGPQKELDIAIYHTLTQVVPRLLGHLNQLMGGITPCFVHGDLWEGNIGKEVSTGKHFIFDLNGYYGHHEVELAYWKTLHHNMRSRDHCTEYFKHMRPSEPAAEVGDRIKLYGIKAYLNYAAHERQRAMRMR